MPRFDGGHAVKHPVYVRPRQNCVTTLFARPLPCSRRLCFLLLCLALQVLDVADGIMEVLVDPNAAGATFEFYG